MHYTKYLQYMSLKELTQEKHKIAEQKEFNQRMFRGELSKQEYASYLTQQYHIFYELESRVLPYYDLLRHKKIEEDITELGVLESKPNDSTIDYVNYLKTLKNDDDFLPHIYLNYLALLYGGQMIKKKIHGSGKLYEFDDPNGSIMSIRKLQKDEWSDEVNKGFDYLIKIFDELQG